MNILVHVWRLVRREPRRAAASALGVTIASALLMSIVLFGTASGTTVSRRALAALPMDAQAVLATGADAGTVSSLVAADPAVTASTAFDLVHFDAAARTTATAATQTSAGVLVGIDARFTDTTGLFRLSAGDVKPGQVTVSRDLATNLGLVPGERATFTLPGGGRTELVVSGVVDITGADLLLGPIDAAHRAVAANAPTNVAVTDRQTLATIAAGVPAGAVAADPASSGTAPTAGAGPTSPVLATEPAVLRELLLRYDHAQLPGNPSEAQRWLDLVRRRIERAAAGSITVVDDASATLEPVAKDLAWGQVLFIFLGLPGIVLALALSRFATDASADATRRHAALLRSRGATRAQLLATFLGSAALTSLVGATIGAAAGVT
ncbi:MAG: FtsX-like permease family protein, partial [Candidatus Limnocylindrales bacterium]